MRTGPTDADQQAPHPHYIDRPAFRFTRSYVRTYVRADNADGEVVHRLMRQDVDVAEDGTLSAVAVAVAGDAND